MSTPNYTIIVPHKNTFNLLIRLLKSIPETELIEVLVIDDKSDEETIINLESYCFKSNVKLLYNKKGGGAGSATNEER